MKGLVRSIFALCTLFLLIISSNSYAVTCTSAEGSNTMVSVPNDIKISIAQAKQADSLVWTSDPLSTSITCTDTENVPGGEAAFIYFDPDQQFGKLDPNLKVGVSYRGQHYFAGKIPLGQPATLPNIDSHCTRLSRTGYKIYIPNYFVPKPGAPSEMVTCRARPQTFTLTYQLIIVTKGTVSGSNPAPIHNLADPLKVFVVDGVGGILKRNGGKSVNYGPKVQGLQNIQYITCNPVVSIDAEQGGNTVDFGRVDGGLAQQGQEATSGPKGFAVVATDVTGSCKGIPFVVTFDTQNPKSSDGVLILPDTSSGFGIAIAAMDNPTQHIRMGQPVDVQGRNTEIKRISAFQASIVWTSNQPRPGPFEASATATITFK